MEVHTNGHHHINNILWEDKVDEAYDYERNGLLKHMMSHVIIEAATNEDGTWKNNPLGTILNYIEKTFVILMKYIDRMKNFKNYAFFKY